MQFAKMLWSIFSGFDSFYSAQCKAEMEPKFKAETDKDLAAKMAKGHDMLKVMLPQHFSFALLQ